MTAPDDYALSELDQVSERYALCYKCGVC